MSLTARPCNKCNYPVFADDSHTCVVQDREVHHPGQFPTEPHWAILTFAKNPAQGRHKSEYRTYFSEGAWTAKITVLTREEVLFTAFKASAPAKVTTSTHVSIDIEK